MYNPEILITNGDISTENKYNLINDMILEERIGGSYQVNGLQGNC